MPSRCSPWSSYCLWTRTFAPWRRFQLLRECKRAPSPSRWATRIPKVCLHPKSMSENVALQARSRLPPCRTARAASSPQPTASSNRTTATFSTSGGLHPARQSRAQGGTMTANRRRRESEALPDSHSELAFRECIPGCGLALPPLGRPLLSSKLAGRAAGRAGCRVLRLGGLGLCCLLPCVIALCRLAPTSSLLPSPPPPCPSPIANCSLLARLRMRDKWR